MDIFLFHFWKNKNMIKKKKNIKKFFVSSVFSVFALSSSSFSVLYIDDDMLAVC